MNAPAVEALNLTKRYGRVCALSDASFFAPGNLVTVLLGENGAGKTTCLKLLLGFLRPDKGWLLSRVSPIAYVPDRPAFFPWLRGRDIIDLTIRASGLRSPALEARIAALSERLGFDPGLLGRRVNGYSLGNQKKLAYLQNLLHPPGLLVADEPFSSLDPAAIRSVRELFLDLKREGTTLLLSSHLISEMERLCDSFIILKNGRVIIQEGLDFLCRSYVFVRLPKGRPVPNTVDRQDTAGSYYWTRISAGALTILADKDRAGTLVEAAGGPDRVGVDPPSLESLYFFFTSP